MNILKYQNKEIQMKDERFLTLTRNHIQPALRVLTQQLPSPCKLHPIPRGGDVIMAMLAYWRKDLCVTTEGFSPAGAIILDDIVDTGQTVKAWRAKGYKIASLFCKVGNLIERDWEPDYCGMILRTTHYIIWPWENNPIQEKAAYERRLVKEKKND